MKRISRIFTIVLAAILVSSLFTFISGAVNANPSALGTYGTVVDTVNNNLTIMKQLDTSNEGNLPYYSPSIVFSYEIDNGVAGFVINDGTNTVSGKAGITDGVVLTDATANFTTAAQTTAMSLTDTITAHVDLTKFTYPGVYRYTITDVTTDATLAAAKVNRSSSFDDELILDVYLAKNDSGLYLVGCSLLKDATDATQSVGNKITGWDEHSVVGPDPKSSMVDSYETYNVTITKTITGDSADKTHQFPFAIALTGTTTDYYAGKGTTVSTSAATAALSTTLTNGESYTITGLPADATVAVTETNDTADSYYVTVANGSNPIVPATQTATNGTQTTGAIELADYAKAANTRDQYASSNLTTLAFTNDLSAVSPTGLIVRFAPFMIIAAAGVVVLLIVRRNKDYSDDI